jgi:arsenite/tail-anchored protein-transporting ATPase
VSENPLQSLTAANVVVVAGKGGVGKTTVTAVIARAAARDGRRVLVLELDGKPTLAELLPERSGDSLTVTSLSAPDLLEEYLNEHGFNRVAKRLSRTGVIDMIGTAAPGIDDVVVLGKVKQFERSGDYDLIVVDGPAAGHAVTFLTSASGLADAVRGGPIKSQSDDVLELLSDPKRCMVVLVTLPETTPVSETIETAYALEDDVGVRLGPVVVNCVDVGVALPDAQLTEQRLADIDESVAATLTAAAAFRRSRRLMESQSLERLASELPLGQVALAMLPRAGLDAADIDLLADRLITPESAHRSERQASS